MLPPNGSLILHHVTVLSTESHWNCHQSAEKEWPGLFIQLDTQNDAPFRYVLRRLLIDNWTLSWDGQNASEALSLRAFDVTQKGVGGQEARLSIRPGI